MRVLVTRPQPQADTLARRLRTMGVTPVVAPVLAITPLAVLRPLPPADALLITSAHALAFLDGAPEPRVAPGPLFAVGGASARAARAKGWTDIRAAAGEGAALCDLIRLTLPRAARLLYLAGRVRRPTVEQTLAAENYVVSVIETYDTAVVGWDAEVKAGLRAALPEAVLHFSPASAAAAWQAAGGAGLQGWFLRCCHLCLSKAVAEPLRDAGCTRLAVAAEPHTEALLQLLGAEPLA